MIRSESDQNENPAGNTTVVISHEYIEQLYELTHSGVYASSVSAYQQVQQRMFELK